MELEKPARCCTKPKNEQSPIMSCGHGQLAIAFSLVGLAQNAAALDDVADTFTLSCAKKNFFGFNVKPAFGPLGARSRHLAREQKK